MFDHSLAKILLRLCAISLMAIALAGATHRLAPCSEGLFCDFERPEDISRLPGSDWALVSQHGDEGLQWVNLEDGSRHGVDLSPDERETMMGSADCNEPPTSIAARGNTVGRVRGKEIAAVINGSDGESRIEFFAIERGSHPVARWTGCTQVPNRYLLNDLAIASNGTIYASHMYDRPNDEAGFAEVLRMFRAAEPTGFVVHWTAEDGWSEVSGTVMSFPNGVAISPNGDRLAIGGTFEQALMIVALPSGNATQIPLPLQPDNVTALADGRFLVTGHTGEPVTGVDGCRPRDAIPCGFPFAVAQIGIGQRVEIIYEHDGSEIPGASVAIPWQDGLILGSAYGDRLTFVSEMSPR
ncbi:hypothetical protein HFP57_15865 [Parasphingopyxis algicola]|uniref:hypothetical protein n=1 Tax=Parasphingopyxis algicola TaxID=2026624 RepID=UPI0015A0CBBF|nr:hypothetical protein [Parasphingopyxis algicola]QLC26359.1 hypothetical protein HFP57_15865 [Parasphingopyxis algicola]